MRFALGTIGGMFGTTVLFSALTANKIMFPEDEAAMRQDPGEFIVETAEDRGAINLRSADIMPTEPSKQIQQFIRAIPTVKQHLHGLYAVGSRLLEQLSGKLNLRASALLPNSHSDGNFSFPVSPKSK